jgi:hypothetical protein
MIRLERPAESPRYLHDVEYLVEVAKSYGYQVSSGDAEWAWGQYSQALYAGWLIMDRRDNQFLMNVLKLYLRPVQ